MEDGFHGYAVIHFSVLTRGLSGIAFANLVAMTTVLIFYASIVVFNERRFPWLRCYNFLRRFVATRLFWPKTAFLCAAVKAIHHGSDELLQRERLRRPGSDSDEEEEEKEEEEEEKEEEDKENEDEKEKEEDEEEREKEEDEEEKKEEDKEEKEEEDEEEKEEEDEEEKEEEDEEEKEEDDEVNYINYLVAHTT